MHTQRKAHEDQRYIEALLNNDHKLIREIYQKHSKDIQYLVLRNGGNIQDAQDLFNELLIELCQQAVDGNFILSCPLNAFLKMMAYRRWLNKINKVEKKKVTLSEMTGYNDIADENLQENINVFELEEKQRALFLAKLHELGENCKKLLETCWTVTPLQKAAELLNISYAYLRKRKSICMKKLTDSIKKSPEYAALNLSS